MNVSIWVPGQRPVLGLVLCLLWGRRVCCVRRGTGDVLWRALLLAALFWPWSQAAAAPPPAPVRGGNLPAPAPQPAAQPAPVPTATMPAVKPNAASPVPAGQTPPTAPAEKVTFAEAVRRALSRSPSVKVALAEIRRFEGLMKEVRASSLPTLNGVLTYTTLDNNRIQGGVLVAGKNQFNAELNLNVPVVAPRQWALWVQARDQVDVAVISAEEARRQVAISTGRAYLTLISQHRLIDVQEQAVQNARAHLQYSRSRYVGGVGTRLDEVRAAQEVSTDQVQLQNAYTALARAREALGVLIAADHPVDVADDAPMGNAPSLDDGLREVSGRSDVRATVRRDRAAQRVYRDRWADYLPYLTFNYQPYYNTPAVLTLPHLGYQGLLVLTIPFYDGGYRYGASQEREALASEARANVEELLRQANSDVRASFESLYRSDDSLKQARDAARFAEDALRLANLAYRAGATTNIEVIDAETAARDAEIAATVAEDNARQARLDLLIASGRFP